MSSARKDDPTKAQLIEDNAELRRRLEEAEQTLEAIRAGEVDALVVADSRGEYIYTLTGAEHVYRVIVETMNEAALMVDLDGTILFCNRRFCDLMRTPMHEVLGHKAIGFTATPQRPTLEAMMAEVQAGPVQQHLTLRAVDGTVVPVLLSASLLQTVEGVSICMVASDLTELEESANSIRVLREQRQALEESESRFRAIFESSQDAIVIVDDRGVNVQANPAAATIFGVTPEQLVGRRISEFVSNAVGFLAVWQEFLASGSFRGEMPITGADGQIRFVEVYAVANILPGRHLSVLRNVTERTLAREALQNANEQLMVQAEEMQSQAEELRITNEELLRNELALRKSEDQYHRLFEDDLTGNFISTPEGQVHLCNPAFAWIFGFSSVDEAVRTNIRDLLYIDYHERELLLERLKHEGKIERLEVWRKRRDGRPIYLVENLVAHFDEHGELCEIKGYIFDDTERKRAEEAVRESEERLRFALETSRTGAWDLNLLDHTAVRSLEHDRIFGYPELLPEWTYERFLEHVLPEDREAVDAKFRHAMEKHRDWNVECRIRRTDGEVRWILAAGRHRANIHRMTGIIQDITERRQAEMTLRELNTSLETKVAQRTKTLEHRARQLQKLALELSQTEERERKRLAEILHDDLQQQLAAAKFHVGILAGRVRGNPVVQSYATQIDGMLRDAVETSRSLSHELSPAVMYHGDLGEILEWLANQIHSKHGMVVQVDTRGEVNTQSEALKTFLFRAVQEMLFNAVKHARVSEARVRVRRVGRYICLSVTDQGRGFDPQELKQTAGFGLMSIRERIGLLGGRMKIHSIKGEGSRFILTVPDGELVVDPGLEIAARLVPGMETDEAEEARPERIFRVLIADDHEIVRQGLASLLNEALDVEVVGVAANGREAVDMTYQLRPDVVIMDVAMPLMSGEEAAKQIRKHLPETRIVALSMYSEVGMIDRMYRAGAESYILKTDPSDELLAAVRGKPQ